MEGEKRKWSEFLQAFVHHLGPVALFSRPGALNVVTCEMCLSNNEATNPWLRIWCDTSLLLWQAQLSGTDKHDFKPVDINLFKLQHL